MIRVLSSLAEQEAKEAYLFFSLSLSSYFFLSKWFETEPARRQQPSRAAVGMLSALPRPPFPTVDGGR